MDLDFRAARVRRQIPRVESATLTNSSGMEDEVRTCFPCPYCYVEIELPLLCVHLQEEHCFDFRNAVCPLCAESFGRDALGHFTVQHSHSIKRRRRCPKSGWSNASTNIIRDLRDLTSFLNGGNGSSLSGPGSGNEPPAPDPILTPFIYTLPLAVSRESQQDNIDVAGEANNIGSCELSLTSCGEIKEQDNEERRQCAAFIQEILMSTIFHGN